MTSVNGAGFSRNMAYIWSKTPRIMANKPYFYKAL